MCFASKFASGVEGASTEMTSLEPGGSCSQSGGGGATAGCAMDGAAAGISKLILTSSMRR